MTVYTRTKITYYDYRVCCNVGNDALRERMDGDSGRCRGCPDEMLQESCPRTINV
jgi:hypothetical protein